MKKPISTPRTAIANLAVAARMFRPIIVDDSGNQWQGDSSAAPPGFAWHGKFEPRPDLKEGQKAPTFDELINAVANAMQEIQGFITNHEALKNILQQTQRAFAEVEGVVLEQKKNEEELRPLETINEVRKIKREHVQMKDVLEHAASSSPEKAWKAAQAWVFRNGVKKPLIFIDEPTDPSAN